MTTVSSLFDQLRSHEALGQLIRFGFTGLAVTILYAGIYWPLATFVMDSRLAVVIAFIAATLVGRRAHSEISFRGHGRRDNPRRIEWRFFIVSLIGFLLNLGFTWVLTVAPWHGPTWWPLIPAICVTPLLTFALSRWWVFR